MHHETAIALARFGLGPRADETPPADPRGWVLSQLQGADPFALNNNDLSTNNLLIAAEYQRTVNRIKEETGVAPPNPVRDLFANGNLEYCTNALSTATPFRERLVWFWANHFSVSQVGPRSAATIAPYIREAIRPHVTGRFTDMLLAVMRHPTMLNYLNQDDSFGPNSHIGERQHKGLNENLARECLELHTVSPASGYTLADVTQFAAVLTGWTYSVNHAPYGFYFNDRAHEPGEKQVMGRTWPEGEDGGVMLLTWLATHPYTQRHIAEKLTRHFCSDTPAEADIQHIAGILRDTGGDLNAATQGVVALPSAWVPLQKLRSPQDYVVASLRAVAAPPELAKLIPPSLHNLGQQMFKAPFPIGWPDRASEWLGGEAVLTRVEFAYSVAGRMPQIDPAAMGDQILGPLMHADTLAAMRHAGSRRDALALLLSSPEFQRR